MLERDFTLDALMALDGTSFVLDAGGHHYVKFEVKLVTATRERPHGLDYSLSLHGPQGERLAGFDNAHDTSERGKMNVRNAWDHRHRFQNVRPYDYSNAGALLNDFWALVDSVLAERGAV